MNVEFQVVTTLEVAKTESGVKHAGCHTYMELSPNLDRTAYFDKNDLLTHTGTKALTNTLVQGLVGNIHQSHQRGQMDSAEHLRYIIAELERGFIAQVTVSTTDLKNG